MLFSDTFSPSAQTQNKAWGGLFRGSGYERCLKHGCVEKEPLVESDLASDMGSMLVGSVLGS
jgi:hypothetical protein